MKHRIIYILLLALLLVLHFSFCAGYVACNVAFCVVAALLLAASVCQHASFGLKASIAIAAYAIWLIVEMIVKDTGLDVDRGYVFCVCWLLFFAMQTLFADNIIRNKLVWLMVICAVFEMLIGFAQLFGLMNNGDSMFTLGGSFRNPAMFAAYLSLVLPFVLAEYLNIRKNADDETKRYILLGSLIFGVYLVAISYSRGAWISSAIGLGYVLGKNAHAKEKIKKVLATQGRRIAAATACAILVAGVVTTLYSIKKDSADGRLLIWKIAVTQPHENMLTGDGIGAFAASYGRWQRNYFANDGGNERERFLADYVTCAYNEFLETYVEQGIVGLLLLLAVLISALRFKPCHESHVSIAAKGALWGTVVLFCVSYPTQCEVLYLQIAVIMALLYSHQKPRKSHDVIGATARLVLLIYIGIFELAPLWQGYSRCIEGREKVMMGDVKGGLELYERAYPMISNNGTFLYYYGAALNIVGKRQKCIDVLEHAQQKSSDANISLLLGKAYKESGDTVKALLAYQNAIDCVPTRLYPRYQKALLLMEAGRESEACRVANEILLTKEKTPTTAGREIKEEMRKLIEKKDKI